MWWHGGHGMENYTEMYISSKKIGRVALKFHSSHSDEQCPEDFVVSVGSITSSIYRNSPVTLT